MVMLKTVIPTVLRLGFLGLVMAWLWSGASLFLVGDERDLARAGIVLLAGALTGIMLLGGRYGYWATLGLSYMLVAASLPGLLPWGGLNSDPMRIVQVDLPALPQPVALAGNGPAAGAGQVSHVTFVKSQSLPQDGVDPDQGVGPTVGKSDFSPLVFVMEGAETE